MGKFSKNLSLFLTLIIAMSCLTLGMLKPVNAQTIPTPSVPEFTLKYVDKSHDVPPTYSKDQFTGNTVVTQAGYHIENKSIELTITNQKSAPYKDANGNTVNFYYDIRWKGHFGDYWADLNSSIGLLASSNQSSSVYTIALGNNSRYGSDFVYSITDISDGGQIDFQVQAYVGYYIKVDENITDPAAIAFHHNEGFYYYSFIGQSSGWTNTQTISIPDGNVTISASCKSNANSFRSRVFLVSNSALAFLNVLCCCDT